MRTPRPEDQTSRHMDDLPLILSSTPRKAMTHLNVLYPQLFFADNLRFVLQYVPLHACTCTAAHELEQPRTS